MPPALEPGHERVSLGLVSVLQAVTAGAVYFQGTGKVDRAPHLTLGHLDASLRAGQTSYVVSADQEANTLDSFTDIEGQAEFDVIALTKYEHTELPYGATTPKRETVQARLAADAKNALRSSERLQEAAGVNVMGVWIPMTEYAPETTLFQGWAVVMLRVVVQFTTGQVGA